MALPILLGMGIWGAGMKKRMDDAEEAKSDREFDREERKRKRAEDEAVRKAAASVNTVVNEPGDGVGPSAILVGDESYGTNNMEGAQKSAQKQRIAQQIGVLSSQGRTKEAFDLEKQQEEMVRLRKAITEQAQGEGLNEFVDDNFAMAPSVEDVKSGKVSMFDLQNVGQFNKTGKHKIPEGSRGRWKVQELENGREEVDFEVIGPDGKPVSPYSARTLQYLANYSAPKRDELQDKRFEQGVRLSQAQQGLDIQRDYKDGMVSAAQARASGGGNIEDVMSPADKIMLNGLRSRAERIESAIATAQAQGTWDPESPGTKDLLAQQARIEDQMQRLAMRYAAQSEAPPPQADPLGLFPVQPAQGKPVAPSGAGQGSDRFRIISAELSAALARRDQFPPGSPERRRLEADIQALGKELKNLPAKERGQAEQRPQSAAPAQSAPRAAPQAAQTVATAPRQSVGAQLGAVVSQGEATAASALDRQAQQYIRSGARAPLEALLKQHGSRLSPQIREQIAQVLGRQG